MTIENQSDALQGALVSKCCHDVISPLTAALLAADTLEMLGAEEGDAMALLRRNLEKMKHVLGVWRLVFGNTQDLSFKPLANALALFSSTQGVSLHISTEAEKECSAIETPTPLAKGIAALLYGLIHQNAKGGTVRLSWAQGKYSLEGKAEPGRVGVQPLSPGSSIVHWARAILQGIGAILEETDKGWIVTP